MNMFDEMNVISSYPLEQAVEDGVLVEIFKNRWKDLSDGMHIVATVHIFEEVSRAGLMEIWNEFVVWRKNVMPTLPEEDRLFSTSMNSRKVWVIEDGAALTPSCIRRTIESSGCPEGRVGPSSPKGRSRVSTGSAAVSEAAFQDMGSM